MKTQTVVTLSCLLALVLIIPVLPAANALDTPPVGVKEGDWIEYDITVTGTSTPPPTHDVRWFRMDVLKVQGAAFSVNVTARYVNGTLGSEIWKFNFAEGDLGGWLIIPANLSAGEKFYDSSRHTGKPVNVTVRGQEQRTVCGASRIVTFGNDSIRHKEWDMITGVSVSSHEVYRNITNKAGWYIDDLTVDIQAVATNLWSPQSQRQDNTMLFAVIIACAVLAATIMSTLFISKKKKTALSHSAQKLIVALTILLVVMFEVGTIFFFPFYDVGFSFAQINLIMQTIWTALVLISMWFRTRGNYFVHEILMVIVMFAWAIGFIAVLFMDPFSTSTDVFASTPLRLVMNALHGIFSVPALVFGVWLVLLWRPGSTAFPAKSRRLAQLLPIFWIVSYVVGVLDFMVLHTTIFG